MNQSITIEQVDQTKRIPAIVSRQNRDKPIADTPCDTLARTALRRFRSSHNSEIRRLWCESIEGSLFIHGRVSTYYLKQQAQETVRSLEGVTRIVNLLEVVYDQTRNGEKDCQ